MKRKKGNILPIRIFGDKVLRKKAEPVTVFDEELEQFLADLTETMYEKDGVGLAAPQVGRSLRIFVVDPFWFTEEGTKDPKIFINPEIVAMKGESDAEEGCLSLPEVYGNVKRAEQVIIRALNENGEKVQYKTGGLFARAIQHENDHLNGVMFVDHIPKLKKITLIKKLKELENRTNKDGVNIG
jgi:peptide deformylase